MKRRLRKVMFIFVSLPLFQAVGCFTDQDARAIIGEFISFTLDVAEIAINNEIDRQFPGS